MVLIVGMSKKLKENSKNKVEIKCAHDSLEKLKSLVPHPKNPNKHTKDQIERLAKIIQYQGFRNPIKVSKLSGYVTAGHGRIEAAKLLKMDVVPVDFQDYDDEAQEMADLVADNAIAEWSTLDLSQINADIGDIGPDFDIEMLGLKSFEVEAFDKKDTNSKEMDLDDFDNFKHNCPKCGFGWNDV